MGWHSAPDFTTGDRFHRNAQSTSPGAGETSICCVSGSPKATTPPIGPAARSLPGRTSKEARPARRMTCSPRPDHRHCNVLRSRGPPSLLQTRATGSPGNEREDRSSGAALVLQVLDRRPHLVRVPGRPVVGGRQPDTPAFRPEATSLTARRCEPNSWHNARKRSVTATDGSSSTAVPL